MAILELNLLRQEHYCMGMLMLVILIPSGLDSVSFGATPIPFCMHSTEFLGVRCCILFVELVVNKPYF